MESDKPSIAPATVWEVLGPVARSRRDELALVSTKARLSFGELHSSVNRAANVLAERGVRRGSTVAVSAQNSVDVVVAFLAVMKLGARWVGIGKALSDPERVRIVRHSGAHTFLSDSPLESDLSRGGGTRLRCAMSLASHEGDSEWQRVMERAAATRKGIECDPYAPAAIAYTSGTTGNPKGVVHSQHGISLPGRYLVTTPDFDGTAVVGVCLPLTILNMLVVAVLPALFAGRPCILVPKLEAATIADWVRREGITNMSIPPPTLYDLCTRDEIEEVALRTLRSPRTGGAELPDRLREMYLERFGQEVVGTYGLTEAPSVVAVDRRGEPHVAGSSGKVVPYVEVRILDTEGSVVPAGETGEICLKARESGPWRGCYRPMLGYWRRPATSREALAGGLLHTGDLGCLDEVENLFVKERKSNLILRGGANVYPAEVERVIRSMDGVVDCAVVGVEDARLGERVAVAIELVAGDVLTAPEIIEYCRKYLARYQVPEYVTFVEYLPRNSMNKVVRELVRDAVQRSRTVEMSACRPGNVG